MIRIGTVPYLVAQPLTEGLSQNPKVTLTVAPPSELADALHAGTLDVALASSVLAFEETLTFWADGPVIASHGPVRSVLLFLRPGIQHPSEVKTVALDAHSKTGQGLTRLLMRDAFGASPSYQEAPPGPFPEGVDAVQRIGDPALRVFSELSDWKVVDLGETWTELTRLPFVFAGWISRVGFSMDSVAPLLQEAADVGLSHREFFVQKGKNTLPLKESFLRRYLFEDMQYRLPAEQVRHALAEFESRLALPVS
ncbi:MAG: menaquinone biosynthesis protein [Planctomycetota bacterium]|nr:menaquinone biosynthesis protein [Planctomycetota bacterium]